MIIVNRKKTVVLVNDKNRLLLVKVVRFLAYRQRCLRLRIDWRGIKFGEDWLSRIETKFETDVKLSEYIPQYKEISYIYDFGDHWEHILEVEGVVGDYDKNYPICIEGEGIAPPEDVGGEPGFEEYLRILADENPSEYKNTVHRNVWKGNNVFDIDLINRRIKRI